MELRPEGMRWKILDEMLSARGAMTEGLAKLTVEKRALRDRMTDVKNKRKKRLAGQNAQEQGALVAAGWSEGTARRISSFILRTMGAKLHAWSGAGVECRRVTLGPY